MNVTLEEPDKGIAVTIKEISFYYEIGKTIFAVEAEAAQIIFIALDLKGLTLYSHILLLFIELEVEVIDNFCLLN